jgi:hypothetical protein
VVQHDLQWIYISGLLQCDFCTAGLLFAYPRKSGSLGFRKTTLDRQMLHEYAHDVDSGVKLLLEAREWMKA